MSEKKVLGSFETGTLAAITLPWCTPWVWFARFAGIKKPRHGRGSFFI
jgi:hypothetical protein